MFNKLKQFQDLKKKAQNIQQVLAQEAVVGSSGWGKVTVKINGNQQITDISIDSSVMDDRAKLESLLKEAANDAIQKIQKVMASKLKDVGGMDLAAEFGEALKKN